MSMIGNYLRLSPAGLAELRANPASVMDLLYPENGDRPPRHLDIDKAWHAIHFLLNGQTWEGRSCTTKVTSVLRLTRLCRSFFAFTASETLPATPGLAASRAVSR